MEQNLTVLSLRNTFIIFLRHVTAVRTVKTRLPMTWNYKITNSCLFWGITLEVVFTATWSQIWQFWR